MELGKIGLGTYPFSNVFGLIDPSDVTKIVNKYLEMGGEYIQTAPYYTSVDSLLKKTLINIPRNRYHIGTLCVKDRQGSKSGKYKSILNQCEDSLMNLGLDYLDLLMTSSAKVNDAPFIETIQALTDLKKQGKIGAIGVCNVNLEQLREYNTNGDVEFVQNRFSLLDQSMSEEFIQYCTDFGISIIPYNVIEWGILTNKILNDINLRDGDLRKKSLKIFSDQAISILHQWAIQDLKPISEKYKTSIEALVILWAFNQKQISTCIVGVSKEEQLISSMQALRLESTLEIVSDLDKSYVILTERIQDQYGKKINEFLANSYGLWSF